MKTPTNPNRPAYRYLRGFALDPGFSTRLDTATINEVVYRIPFEDVKPGPVGEYVEVVDYDPASGCWYEPVDLRNEYVASQQGLAPSEGDPQFHQQFVYTVAMKTIKHFERALGRKVIWKPRRYDETGGTSEQIKKDFWAYEPRLRIHPHAIRDANAYYDPTRIAVLFGYFSAADQLVGTNHPGGTVFTCLSPDIVAHEVTHALLDTVHPRYMEDTNKDVGAFHEGFADIVALLSRFTFGHLVEHQLYQSAGRMDRYTALGELATQFGEALEDSRGALRSAIGSWVNGKWEPKKPDPSDYRSLSEAHDLGALLVATVFDAFQRVYKHRTQDLLRIATNGTGVLPDGNVSRDLVHRLALEAGVIAEHLLHICIRALDYCPPVDITFGNYLRALVTADLDIAPEDEVGYRVALIEAFRARGIFPDRVSSMSVESLRWSRPEMKEGEKAFFRRSLHPLITKIREVVATSDRKRIFDLSQDMREQWHGELMRKVNAKEADARESFLKQLGLTSKGVGELFGKERTESKKLKFKRGDGSVMPLHEAPPIEVHAIRPVFRAGREGKQVEQVLITVTQTVRVELEGHRRDGGVVFRGGATLILPMNDLEDAHYEPEYAIVKNVASWERLERQVNYMDNADDGAAAAVRNTYTAGTHDRRISLKHLHNH